MCRSGYLCTSLSAETWLKVRKNAETTNEPAMAYTILLCAEFNYGCISLFSKNCIDLSDVLN